MVNSNTSKKKCNFFTSKNKCSFSILIIMIILATMYCISLFNPIINKNKIKPNKTQCDSDSDSDKKTKHKIFLNMDLLSYSLYINLFILIFTLIIFVIIEMLNTSLKTNLNVFQMTNLIYKCVPYFVALNIIIFLTYNMSTKPKLNRKNTRTYMIINCLLQILLCAKIYVLKFMC